jgi:hypothetical protein
MSGPPPKNPGVRARKNKASTRAILAEREDEDVEIPELPPLTVEMTDDEGNVCTVERQWHPLTVLWWQAIWPSPMAAEWHSSDVFGLYALAMLYDKVYKTGGNAGAHAEMRLGRAPYGLTPIDRRRLEWTIESADKAQAEGDRRRQVVATAPAVPKPEADLRLIVS